MPFIRPAEGGHYPEAYPPTLAISGEGLFTPSQVTFHNMAGTVEPANQLLWV